MKITRNRIITFITLFTVALSGRNLKATVTDKQVALVRDLYPVTSVPTVSVVQSQLNVASTANYGNYGLTDPSPVVHAYASNTSTAPNIGGYGRTAEIISKLNLINFLIDPHVVLHTKTPITAIQETPVHVANRHESKTITSLNGATGALQTHTITTSTPVIGKLQQVIIIFYNLANNCL